MRAFITIIALVNYKFYKDRYNIYHVCLQMGYMEKYYYL